MGLPTRKTIVEELTAKGVSHSPTAKYWDLYKLLKESAPAPPIAQKLKARVGEQQVTMKTTVKKVASDSFPPQLIDRAKKMGFADEQIDTYTDAEKLKAACDAVKPEVTPHLPPKKRQIFRPFKDEPKGEPAQAVCTSTITTLRAEHLVRAGYDQSNLEVFCRKEKIRPETIQKVTVIRNYVPNKREILTTTMIIDYFKKE